MMQGRLEALRQAFGRSGLRYELVSSGALFAYVKHPFTDETAKQVAMRLAGEHDVLCLPGSMFGPGQEQLSPHRLRQCRGLRHGDAGGQADREPGAEEAQISARSVSSSGRAIT